MVQTTNRAKSRRRRLRRRIAAIAGYVVIAILLAWFLELRLPTTVIFVRHADTDAPGAEAAGDPPLNALGRLRAEHLADFLERVDVLGGVNAIYAAPSLRTQETAAPLAKRLGLAVAVTDHAEIEGFMGDVLREHTGDIVLVVTDAELIAPLVAELHGHQSIPAIAPDEYGNVYIVTIPRFSGVKTLRLQYAQGLEAAAAANPVNGP